MSGKNLDLSILLKMVDQVTAPAKRITGITGRLAQSLGQAKDAIRQINQQAKRVEYLEGLNTKLGASSQKLTEAQQRLKGLKQELAAATAAGQNTAKLRKQLESAGSAVGKLSEQHDALRKRVGEVRKELKGAGIDTGRLGTAKTGLSAKAEALNRKLEQQKRLLNSARWTSDQLGKSWQKLKTTGKWLVGGLVGGALAVSSAGMPMLNKAAQFEGYETVLTTIEGSSAKAKESMKWISEFATKTPFEMGEVNEAFVRLRSYGLDPTNGLLKTLGDTSSAMGKPVMQAVEAIADAVTGENERLKELGIVARAEGDLFNYEYTGKDGVQRTLSALKDDRKAIEGVLRRIWSEKFDGGMEAQSKNWTGLTSNMSDQWSRFQLMIMQSGPFEKLKGHLQETLNKIDAMAANGELQAWAERIGGRIVEVIDWVGSLGLRIWDLGQSAYQGVAHVSDFVGGWDNLALAIASLKLLPIIDLVKQVGGGLKGAGAALAWLGRLAMAHPLIAVAAGLAAVAGLVIANWDAIREWAQPYWNRLSAIFTGAVQAITNLFLNWTPLGLIIQHWDSITAYLGTLPTRFVDAGRNIIAGLGAGIDEKIEWVKGKLLGLGDLLPEWLRNKLKIHSPSRVFADIGGNISDGVGVGVEGKGKTALDAVRRLGKKLPGALPASLAIGLTTATPAYADTQAARQPTEAAAQAQSAALPTLRTETLFAGRLELPQLPKLAGQATYTSKLDTLPALPTLRTEALFAGRMELPQLPKLAGQATYTSKLDSLPALPPLRAEALYVARLELPPMPQVEAEATTRGAPIRTGAATKAGSSEAGTGGQIVINEHNEFHFHVGAGADTRELEQMIRRLLDERERTRSSRIRARLIDEV